VNAPPPASDQTLQTYLYEAELRFKLQVRRFGLFAQAGAGLGQLSTNLLDLFTVTGGRLFSAALVAGGGLDYHTLNRHFSFGLNSEYVWLAQMGPGGSHGLTINGYLRYTH
jgi:hypothetical protein